MNPHIQQTQIPLDAKVMAFILTSIVGGFFSSPSWGLESKKNIAEPSWDIQSLILVPIKEPPKLPLKKSQSAIFELSFGSGVGIFQDIQVPIDPFTGSRIDGRPGGKENIDHTGLPFYLLGSYQFQGLNWNFTPISTSITTIKTLAGSQDPPDSSYTRVDFATVATYKNKLSLLSLREFHASGTASYRRSTYSSISNGHYVASPMVGGKFNLFWTLFSLKFAYCHGLLPEFGYSEEVFWGGQKLPSSTATLESFALLGEWLVNHTTSFELGFDLETSKINLNDVRDYQQFNLDTEGIFESRIYRLQTSIFKTGFKKAF